MREDVNPRKPVMRLDLVNRNTYTHANGTVISEGDRYGFRVVMKTGEIRTFMALMPSDLSHDWIDITADVTAGRYIVSERQMDIAYLRTSEVEDFNAALKSNGRSIEEFDILATPLTLADPARKISALLGTITISNSKSGVERTYERGHMSDWLTEFRNDLKARKV